MPDQTPPLERVADGYKALYAERLEQGGGFERFAYGRLAELGLRPRHSRSRREQLEVGENDLGIEIKFNTGHWLWGTLYIETDEKSHPRNAEFVRSGIYRRDNALHYLIGDRRKFWLFRIERLRELEREPGPIDGHRYKHTANSYETGHGFRLPLDVADREAVFIWMVGHGWTQVVRPERGGR